MVLLARTLCFLLVSVFVFVLYLRVRVCPGLQTVSSSPLFVQAAGRFAGGLLRCSGTVGRQRWFSSACLIVTRSTNQPALAVLAPLVQCVYLSSKLENLRGKLRPGDGFVCGEACLASLLVDNAKMLCDLDFPRGVHCRNVDIHVPKGVVRVFTANHSWETFWLAAARLR